MSAGHEANWDHLCTFISQVMQQKNVPGVAVGILHQGEEATAGFGVTNVDHPLPVTDETLFQIGSITKTFTGTALMRLVEMEKVDLDTAVRTYVPDFKVVDATASSQATVRHLLTHMSGWVGDFFIDTGSGDDALEKFVTRMAELEQLAPLGKVWSYNNAGFSLCGYIIELVTDKSYPTALKELVLEPLGLDSAFLDPGEVMTHRFAVGHSVGEQGPAVARPWPLPRQVWPAGGITCHVKDLLLYARFHLGDGTTENGDRLLSPVSLTSMRTPQVTVWGKEAWGLTWALDEVDGRRRILHRGSTVGQETLLVLIPEHDFAVAILTNADRGIEVTREVSRWALKEYLGLEESDPEPIEATEAIFAPYVGRYSRPFAELELGILGGRLVGQFTPKGSFPIEDAPVPPPPPPMSFALCEKDRLLAMDGAFKGRTADIVRKADGTIGWLRAMGRTSRIYARQT